MSDFISCANLYILTVFSLILLLLSHIRAEALKRGCQKVGSGVTSPGSTSGMHAPHMMSRKGRGTFTNPKYSCMYTPTHTRAGIDESLLSPHASTHTQRKRKPWTTHPHAHGSFPSTFAHTNVSPFFSVCVGSKLEEINSG